MSVDEQNEQAVSNNHITAFTQKDSGFQQTKYFFTYHIKDDESFSDAFKNLDDLKNHCKDYIWGEEYGDNGDTPHIQGAFVLYKKQRADYLNKHYFKNNCHLVKLLNWDKAFQYCQKEGNRIFSNHRITVLKKLACDDPNKLFSWQKEILKIVNEEPDDRSIYWFKGDGNNGKTTFCKFLIRKYEAIILAGKCADMKNAIVEYKDNMHYLPELICINIPKSFDSNYLSYTGIEEVKDMCFYSGKYKGGMIDGNPPHLIIFSNEYPEIDKCSKDRWKIFNIEKDKWIKFKGDKFIDDESY